MPYPRYNKNNPNRPGYKQVFHVGDFLCWQDKIGQQHSGIVAYVATPGSELPNEYFREGRQYSSRRTSFGRYIVDCGVLNREVTGQSVVCYWAVSFANETAKLDDLYDTTLGLL